jgi:hypothetical protein
MRNGPTRDRLAIDLPTDAGPGASRFDVACGPQVRDTCAGHVRRWARDRALSERAADRLCVLTSAAVGHGLRYGPHGVSVIIRWMDPDRIRIDVRWHGCSGVTRSSVDTQALESTIDLFDSVAESWGFGPGSPGSHWMVVDSRR